VYLDADRCSIHPRRPQMCREMDCRRVAASVTYTDARKLHAVHALPLPVWQRGRELLQAWRSAQPPRH
jgi:hypothetical protein